MKKFFYVLPAVILVYILTVLMGCTPKPEVTPTESPSPAETISESMRVRSDRLIAEGERLYEDGRFEEAIKMYDEVLEIDDTNISALNGKAECLVSLKKWEEALVVLNRLLTVDPDHVNGLLVRSRVHLMMGNADMALADTRRATKNSPFTFRTNFDMAISLIEAQKYDEGIHLLNKTMDLAETFEQKYSVYVQLTMASINKGDLREAEKYAKQSLEYDESPTHAYILLMDIYTDLGEESEDNEELIEKAMEMYEKYKESDPDEKLIDFLGEKLRAKIYDKLGTIHRIRMELDTAKEYYEKSLKIFPDNQVALVNYIGLLASMGYPDEAKKYAQTWLDMNPNPPMDTDDFGNQAIIYMMLGQDQKAIQLMNTAINREPDEAANYGNRALIYYYMGDKQAYDRDFQRFMVMASNEEKKYTEKILPMLKSRVKEPQQ